ncbi:hypothetical protein LEP1GSC043_1311 [Leptospira weilii str. Ecochallenge]|uniref:Uncharacterized protein n=1 Tax=Leptospira weilii str. Ecochallenge TaxID=1049986 RepID=N1TUJ6_9LEPT|nr:hypothetical protein LEP1GSC043_1311 [Leptospira weilii str. Ecochallenge]
MDLSKNYKIRLIPLISTISKNNSSFLKSNISIKIGIQNLIHFLKLKPRNCRFAFGYRISLKIGNSEL